MHPASAVIPRIDDISGSNDLNDAVIALNLVIQSLEAIAPSTCAQVSCKPPSLAGGAELSLIHSGETSVWTEW